MFTARPQNSTEYLINLHVGLCVCHVGTIQPMEGQWVSELVSQSWNISLLYSIASTASLVNTTLNIRYKMTKNRPEICFFKLKCTKTRFRLGLCASAPDPSRGAYDAPSDLLVGWGGDSPSLFLSHWCWIELGAGASVLRPHTQIPGYVSGRCIILMTDLSSWKNLNGHISAMGHPIHFMFGSTAGCSWPH